MIKTSSSNQSESLNLGYPLENEEEPLLTVDEVLGVEPPEELTEIPAEKEVSEKLQDTPYNRWKKEPNQSTLYACTKSLQPTIDSVLASIGAAGNPQLMAKARVVTGKAIKSYNPAAGASLKTWVSQQLRQLTREARKSNDITGVGDKIQLDAYAIHRAETELEDELGQEPTVQEIADRAHMSVRRIENVRKKMKPVTTEGAWEEGSNTGLKGGETDFSQDALDYVYADSDRIDRKVLEYTTGYGGNDPLSNAEIMKRLGLNDVQLSRRKNRLSLRMKKIMEDLEAIQ